MFSVQYKLTDLLGSVIKFSSGENDDSSFFLCLSFIDIEFVYSSDEFPLSALVEFFESVDAWVERIKCLFMFRVLSDAWVKRRHKVKVE
jgi:hypothetical protein